MAVASFPTGFWVFWSWSENPNSTADVLFWLFHQMASRPGTNCFKTSLLSNILILQQPVTGLTPARIGRFEHFTANESMVGEKCIVCLEDLEAGTEMVRLDCHVSHYFCRNCTYGWFENDNTCPYCNRVFY